MRHLDAAYNLARWYLKSDQDAADVVQESVLKAFKSFDSFRGADAKAWLLQIVRNGSLRWLEKRARTAAASFEEEIGEFQAVGLADDPEASAIRNAQSACFEAQIEALPDSFREIVVLREFESMSYQEIAQVIGVPVGTVMSRLSRARAALAGAIRDNCLEETP